MIIIKTSNGDAFVNENEIHIVEHDRLDRQAIIRSAKDGLNCIIHDVDAIIYTNEAYTTAAEIDADSQPGYASDGIEKLRQEMKRLEELAKEERRKECPSLLNLQTDGNACRFINICRDNGINTIGDLLKQGRVRILRLKNIGDRSAKLADTALKNLYGIEAW